MNNPILITGGLGFIGSHTAVVLAEAGVPIVILDNQSNSSPKVLARLARLLGKNGDYRYKSIFA